jgi:hypothetical protein
MILFTEFIVFLCCRISVSAILKINLRLYYSLLTIIQVIARTTDNAKFTQLKIV